MKRYSKQLKSIVFGLFVILFSAGITFSSCSTKPSGEEAGDPVEETSGEEIPTDSTSSDSEHPEHPDN